jgi:DNA recombination protein RmuC
VPLIVVALFFLVILGCLIVLLTRKSGFNPSLLDEQFGTIAKAQERAERVLREDIARGREESAASARQDRQELQSAFKSLWDSMHKQMAAIAELQRNHLEGLTNQLTALTQSNEQRLESVRSAIEAQLRQIREDNARQLDQMRATVDEKLQGTLERRLGESFKQVSERLEQVHQGLGEMQALANGVGDLKRVLTNVRTRGTWGEIQLEALLEQILSPEQYAKNVKPNEQSEAIVEFAIRLPGRDDEGDAPVWLPIDAKFPTEDYQRLIDAQESADPVAAEAAAKMLASRIRASAKDISDKYLCPPATTDFGIMYLPTEGLYAEVARRPALTEGIQRDFRVVVAGPTTFAALLNSLQMGFRTLAIQQRSSEVWKVLGAVKTEFGKFGGVLDGVKKKLDQASSTMDDAARRSRAIERSLRKVEELPAAESQVLLGSNGDEDVQLAE